MIINSVQYGIPYRTSLILWLAIIIKMFLCIEIFDFFNIYDQNSNDN